VIHAEYGVELPFVLDNHAGAKLCGFCAAHNLPIKCISETSPGACIPKRARKITRGTPEQPRR
jgi:hypothetical protein